MPSVTTIKLGSGTLRLFALALTMVLGLAVAPPASAQDLDSARASGAVVETASGYLEARSSDSAIRQLVQSVNAQRRSHYERVAGQNGVSVETVAATAGADLTARYPSR